MNFDEVFGTFTVLADLSSEEASRWAYLVLSCIADISERLIPDFEEEKYSRRLNEAAAALTLYRYRKILSARGELSGIKAGDVTITDARGSVDSARELYIESLEKIADIVTDNYFTFGRTDSLCTSD